MKIQRFINNRDKYKVDLTYQRLPNAWTKEDRKCLIDTILRSEPMPLFFVNYKSDEDLYYIVDGQQRLSCIKLFYDNKLRLSGKFSGTELDGKTFNGVDPLGEWEKEKFLNYDLKFHIMEDYDDDRVRLIFSRLQRGKPLSVGERLNAKPGKIVNTMRKLAEHDFMHKSIAVVQERYGVFPDIARILFYEMFRAKNCGPQEVYAFFEKYSNLDTTSKECKNAERVLNFLALCFPPKPGKYKFLEKHAWVFAVYTMLRELKLKYSLIGKEQDIHDFIKSFHSKVYNEDLRASNAILQKFYDNIRGGLSEKIITLRRDILIREFCEKYKLEELDDKRQITDEEKISIFAKSPLCEGCGLEFKDYKNAEYHHKVRYADGGKTEIDNIMILCHDCHDEVHSSTEISVSSVDDDKFE